MANIQNELNNIKNAVFGKDVRDSIHDAIKTCYDDASIVNDNANMEVKIARGVYGTLGDRLNEVDSQLEHNMNESNIKINSLNNAKATKEEVEVERKRIDLLTRVQQGETEGNTELIDIRIDVYGKEHKSAGSSIRSQINKIVEGYKIDERFNLWDKNNFDESGHYGLDGTWTSLEEWGSTGFIPFDITKSYLQNFEGYITFWDSDKNFLSSMNNPGNYVIIDAPSTNVSYINCAVKKAKYANAYMIVMGGDSSQVRYVDTKVSCDNDMIEKRNAKNLFNKKAYIPYYYRDYQTGDYNFNEIFWASDYIEVDYKKEYIASTHGHITFYDEAKRFLFGVNSNKTSIANDERVKYCIVTFNSTKLDTWMFVEGDTLPENYIPHEVEFLKQEVKISEDNLSYDLKNKLLNATISDLNGLKWCVLGDSITSTNYANIRYWEYIATRNNMTVENHGISGSRIAKGSDRSDEMSTRYLDMSDDADIITVFGGTNDWSARGSISLGVLGDTENTTFYGALDVLCKGLVEKYPGKRIGYISPMQRYNVKSYDKEWMKYQEAIKEVCGRYSIPVLDMNKEGSLAISMSNAIKTAYTIDGLHPNDEGHKVMARRIEQFIKSL